LPRRKPCMPGGWLRRSIAHFGLSHRLPFRYSLMPSRRHSRQTGSRWRPIESEVRSQRSGYTRRFFGGRQPLCGSGVTSSMALTFRRADWGGVRAAWRPEPGPFTRTSFSLRPNLVAFSAAVSAARWAANGVLFRLPLKPTVPAEAKQSVSPFVSVMVTMVLLNVALMWAMPRLTFRRAFRFLLLATKSAPQTIANHVVP